MYRTPFKLWKVILAPLTMSLVLASVLSACSSAPSPTPAPVAGTAKEAPKEAPKEAAKSTGPQAGGTLVWGMHIDLDVLDVQKSFALSTGMVLGRNVFDRLVEHNEKLEIVPGLAESWEPNADGSVWTFRLRKGVKFHDGTPFNAEAVKFNVERALNPELKLPAGNFSWTGVDKVEIVDENTVRITCKGPNAALLNNIADSGLGAIQSPTTVKGSPDGRFNPVGTGPFKFVKWTPGDELVLEANPEYWGGRPYLDKIVIKPVPDSAARVAMLEKGEVQLITQTPLQQITRLKGIKDIAIDMPESTSWTYISLNNQKAPFDDLTVRQAINYAVDKKKILDTILFGVGRVADSPLGSAYPVHAASPAYEYDSKKAKALLAEAGWKAGSDGILTKDGKRFAVTLLMPIGRFAAGQEIAEAVQAYLKDVGIEVKVVSQEWATYSASIRKPFEQFEFDMVMAGWGTADPDTGMRYALHSASAPPKGGNFAFYKNTRVDELIDQGVKTTDVSGRKAAYKEAQELVMKDAAWLFMLERREAVSRRAVLNDVKPVPSSAGLIDVRRAWLAK